MKILNINGISSIKHSSVTFNKPIFKGGLKDTAEFSLNKSESMKIDEKINSLDKEIAHLFEKKDALNQNISLQKQKSDNNNSIYKLYREMKQCEAKIKQLEKNKELYVIYLRQYLLHEKTAFIYNPELSDNDKQKIINSTPEIIDSSDLVSEIALNDNSVLQRWIQDNNLEIDEFNGIIYIDLKYPKNSEFIDDVKSKLPTSIHSAEFTGKYNFSETDLQNCIKNGKIVPLSSSSSGYTYDFLIDLANPVNKETLEKHLKTTPIPSEKYFKQNNNSANLVPVSYLSQLGFGTPKELFKLVKGGYLEGCINSKEKDGKTKYFVKVDIASIDNQYKLDMLRKDNTSILEVKDFSKKYNIKYSDVITAIENGELDFINEYVLEFDHNKVFLDLNSEKNQQFTDKLLFEQELDRLVKQEKKIKQNENKSLKMKLVWHFCPKTRDIAREIARKDSFLAYVINRKEEGEILEPEEEAALLCYHKQIWNKSGTEEYKNAIHMANKVIEQFESGHFELIDDDVIEIINSYNK